MIHKLEISDRTQPSAAELEANTIYVATLRGGNGGAKDVAGIPLSSDETWSFTTAVIP